MLLIIDGNSLINRAFYGVPEMTTKTGIHTNAVLGFINYINRLMDDYKPTHMAVAFDVKSKTFRNDLCADYKGNRKKMSDELREQFPIIEEVLEALNIKALKYEGFEADDIIGSVSKMFSRSNIKVKVATGDKDALQLTDDNIEVLYFKKGGFIPYTLDMIKDEFGVKPINLIDYKAIAGDSADNISGIKGMGNKTAIKYLTRFKTIEEIYNNLDEITEKRPKKLFEEYKDSCFLSKKLATIITDMDLGLEIDDLLLNPYSPNDIIEVLTKYEFSRLVNRYKSEVKDIAKNINEDIDYEIVENKEEIEKLLNSIKADYVYLEIVFEDKCILTLSLDKIYYMEIDYKDISIIKDFIEDENIKKISYYNKDLYLNLYKYNISNKGFVFDLFLSSYLLDPSQKSYKLEDILLRENIILSSDNMDKIKYYSYRNFYIKEMYKKHIKLLEEEGLLSLFNDVEMPLTEILASMQHEGVKVDYDEIDRIDKYLTEYIENLTEKIYELSGEKFNINSPKQLGIVLFEKMKLPIIKKTKTSYSTSHDVLEKLKYEHEIIQLIMDYRVHTKLKSTYIDSMRKLVNKNTNSVHSSFNQTVTETGRLSSTEPNMQNIPVKIEIGKEIRKIFVPREDYIFVSADYSQIELRVLAHMADEKALIEAFKNNIDIHSLTAKNIFHVEIDEVDSLKRSRAKEVNFGIIYGMSEYGLSENINISRYEAKEYISRYFETYPNIKVYMDKTIEECKSSGFVTTILGRKRVIKNINSKNFHLRELAKRMAMNTPIQGTAADIIKIAMIRVYNEIKNKNLKSKLVLQVHDELIIETKKDEIDIIKNILKEEMENAVKLKVKLTVDINEGKSWYELK